MRRCLKTGFTVCVATVNQILFSDSQLKCKLLVKRENGENTDQALRSSLTWICTVCLVFLSWNFRIYIVILFHEINAMYSKVLSYPKTVLLGELISWLLSKC